MVKDEKSPFFKKSSEVLTEDGEIACYVTNLTKAVVKDDKPVHIGVAILQWSKLLFLRYFTFVVHVHYILRYMYWLEEHLEEGAFKTCYADTDSMALALTRSDSEHKDPEQNLRSLFDPIVKPTKKDSWEATWKDWFVTTNETWDIRKPGKLKGEYISQNMCQNMCQIMCPNMCQNMNQFMY